MFLLSNKGILASFLYFSVFFVVCCFSNAWSDQPAVGNSVSPNEQIARAGGGRGGNRNANVNRNANINRNANLNRNADLNRHGQLNNQTIHPNARNEMYRNNYNRYNYGGYNAAQYPGYVAPMVPAVVPAPVYNTGVVNPAYNVNPYAVPQTYTTPQPQTYTTPQPYVTPQP